MTVVLDGRGAVRYRGTGIGTYTAALIQGLAATREPGDRLIVCLPAEAEAEPLPLETAPPPGEGAAGAVLSRRLAPGPREAEEEEIAAICRQAGADLLHSPQNGRGLPEVDCAVIVTIHDLIPFLLPQTCSQSYLVDCLGQTPPAVERSAKIIAVSAFVARCLAEVLEAAPDRIAVIHEAAGPAFRPAGDDAGVAVGTAPPVVLPAAPGSYLLHTGGTSRRKNLMALLQALVALAGLAPEDRPALVLTGREGPDAGRLREAAGRLGLADRVVLTGVLPEETMPWVYRQARAVACPSLHEGFSLPVVEAMASGVPVLASDIPVHREIAGPAAVFFDPYQPLDLAGALARVLGNSSLRRRLVAAGLRRSRRYSWLRSARETWLAYRWAAGAT